MHMRIPLLAALALAPSPAASADPLDCNDMASVVSGMLVDRMQLPEYLALSTAEAADATFRMNYFHAERREYQVLAKARGRFVARDHVQELCLAGIRLRAFLFGLCRHRPCRHQSSYRYTVTSVSGP